MLPETVGCSIGEQRAAQIEVSEAPPQIIWCFRRSEHESVTVEREIDLITGCETEFVADRLRDHDLTFRADTISHTDQYNHRMAQAQQHERRGEDGGSPHRWNGNRMEPVPPL